MSVFDRFFKLSTSASIQLQKENAINVITKAVNNKVTSQEASRMYDVISAKAMTLDNDQARVTEAMNILTSMKADWFTKEEKENFVAGVWLCECGRDSKNKRGITYINPEELQYTKRAILGTKFKNI